MGLKINGSTSGSIEIDVPAVAGTDTSITIPAKNGGTFIVEESTGNIDLGPLDINGSASDDSVNIDGSGRLLVGATTARSTLAGSSVTPAFQIEGTGYDGSSLSLVRNVNSGGNGEIILGKTRSASNGGVTIVSSDDTLGGIRFDGADGSDFATGALIAAQVDGTPGANDMPGRLVFSTTVDGASSPTERMRITSNGTHKMFSKTNFDTLELRYQGSPDGGNDIQQCYRDATMTTGALVCKIRSDGNLYNTNGTYGTLSDRKLKENIVDASSQWDDIKALQVRNYNFREDTGHETHTQIGVVAQEVELVSPRLVTESPDRDDDGNDLGTTTKYVNLSVLYMKSVKALQEAMTRIEALEAANASLEARLTALEGGAS